MNACFRPTIAMNTHNVPIQWVHFSVYAWQVIPVMALVVKTLMNVWQRPITVAQMRNVQILWGRLSVNACRVMKEMVLVVRT